MGVLILILYYVQQADKTLFLNQDADVDLEIETVYMETH
jgi:hypothetical protein